jgi:hypothetical protein
MGAEFVVGIMVKVGDKPGRSKSSQLCLLGPQGSDTRISTKFNFEVAGWQGLENRRLR